MQYQQLAPSERYHIQALREQGYSMSEIGRRLGRNKSTISRELSRNSSEEDYCGGKAQTASVHRRKTAKKGCKRSVEILAILETYMAFGFSPEAISGRLEKERGKKIISHESLYRYIAEDKRNGGALFESLCRAPRPYKRRFGSKDRRGQIKGRVPMSERPKEADERSELGHLEGDTVHGPGECLVTVNDRHSRYFWIKKVADRGAEAVTEALREILAAAGSKTLTVDNGKEFAAHQALTESTGIQVYFARPYRSCDRGSNENLNGLIRRKYPKGTDFSKVSDEDIRRLQMSINLKPKK
ncbi:IS30 family transposase [Microbulbifer aggregans]|uniref:IS30 family transposase n=1 Tax=Microbulbifer aggregans TaxID=1769779 RepID=UPI001CFC6C61|nr:IS30 family transposase [Microbulbifer aggregans]